MADTNAQTFDMEVAILQRRVSELETELQEKDQDLFTAAQLGNKLLDSNQELETRLEELAKEYSEKIEALEQAKYSIQLKLDREKANSQSLQQEMENVRSELEEVHKRKERRMEEVYSQKVHGVMSLNEDLKMDVQRLEVQAKTQQEKLRKQEEMLEQLNEDASSKGNTTVLQHELRDLEEMCAHTKAANEDLEMKLLDLEASNEVLHMENSSLGGRVEALEEECEERSKNANAWFEALQEAKERIFEVNAEVERLKMDAVGEIPGCGNSLFGEVDDRRQEVQRKMITLQVKYDTLEKSHSTTKHHLKKLKAEMSALLCQYGATTADAAHVQRLQRALEQSRSETQTLLTKVHKLEKQHAEVAGYERQRCMSAFIDFGDKKEYIQFLERELEQHRGEKVTALRELDMKRTQLLWETNKLSDTEARLHHSEQEQAKSKKEVTKLRLRLQEAVEKLTEAQATCRQLEGEKELLEEHLKSRGRRGIEQTRRRSQIAPQARAAGGSLQSSVVTEDLSESKLQSVQPQEEGGRTQKENQAPAVQKRREINLLEELEREFSEEPLGSRRLEKCRLLSSKSEAVGAGVTNSSTETCPRQLGPTNPTVTQRSRVVHMNNKSPNQCPQQ